MNHAKIEQAFRLMNDMLRDGAHAPMIDFGFGVKVTACRVRRGLLSSTAYHIEVSAKAPTVLNAHCAAMLVDDVLDTARRASA